MEIKETAKGNTEFTCRENIKSLSLLAINSGNAFVEPVLTFIKCYEKEQSRPRGSGYQAAGSKMKTNNKRTTLETEHRDRSSMPAIRQCPRGTHHK